MANWTGQTMILSAEDIFSIIDSMKEANNDLISAVAAYSSVIQDEISQQSKEMVDRLNVLVEEIQAKLTSKAEHLKKGGERIVAAEESISDKIKNLRK